MEEGTVKREAGLEASLGMASVCLELPEGEVRWSCQIRLGVKVKLKLTFKVPYLPATLNSSFENHVIIHTCIL